MTTHPIPDRAPDVDVKRLMRLQGLTDRDRVRATTLTDWWLDLAMSDLEDLIPKAIEYSAHDLKWTGVLLTELAKAPLTVGDAEMTCWFYLMSKVMRAWGAVKEGRAPSDDTLRDVRIYATMIQRIREVGAWPGWERS